VYTMVVEIDN